jgi:hypothetical protein
MAALVITSLWSILMILTTIISGADQAFDLLLSGSPLLPLSAQDTQDITCFIKILTPALI